jgi:hypothetical protein
LPALIGSVFGSAVFDGAFNDFGNDVFGSGCIFGSGVLGGVFNGSGNNVVGSGVFFGSSGFGNGVIDSFGNAVFGSSDFRCGIFATITEKVLLEELAFPCRNLQRHRTSSCPNTDSRAPKNSIGYD